MTKQTFLQCVLMMAMTFAGINPITVGAKSPLPATSFPVLFFGKQTITVDDYKASTQQVETFSHVDYSASSDDWLTSTVDGNGTLILSLAENDHDSPRTATVDIRCDNGLTSTLTVVQKGFNLAATYGKQIVASMYIKPTSAVASSTQGGTPISNSYDDDVNTIYHSSWSGYDPANESAWPVLTYYFENGISNFTGIYYVPRQDAGNGRFKVYEVFVRPADSDDFVSIGTYNAEGTNDTRHITIPEAYREGVTAVKFVVHSSIGDSATKCFASCAEMRFEGTSAWTQCTPTSATATSFQDNYPIEKSYDDNTSTFYHSNWDGFSSSDASSYPVLTYFFEEPIAHLDKIQYYPYYNGSQGSDNGSFGVFDLEVLPAGATDYVTIGQYNFGESSSMSSITLTENNTNIAAVRFTVHSGKYDAGSKELASCAEMKFWSKNEDTEGSGTTTTNSWAEDVALAFNDTLLTELKPGVTQDDINSISNDLLRNLAQLMFDGKYTSEGRVASQTAVKSVADLAEEWSTPGKYYDQMEGATGVMLTPGTYIVMVEGLDDTKSSINMRCIGWTVKEGETFKSETFPLTNGVNVITKTSDWNGLTYICYYNTDGVAEAVPPTVKVHIVGGYVNGIITAEKSNDENQTTLDNACYTTIDCVGQRVHSVWEVEALKQYAKGKYIQYVNCLDLLIMWEHRLLGFEKYGMIPTNKTLAYVNYNFYMYQGGSGVTFKYDTQSRVCNPDAIMYKDDDVVWGLSHEWGHQHQMHPYFCWGGLGETSNNMNSCYNVLHMGYEGTRIQNAWDGVRKHFLDEDYSDISDLQTKRHDAVVAAGNGTFDWCAKIKAFAAAQDTTVTKPSENIKFALGNNEVGVEETLAPLFMLHCYFSEPQTNRLDEDYHKDFTMDLYQSLRNTPKTDTPDKYELLARAQDGESGAYEKFIAAYPESVWTTQGYITASSNRYQNTLPFIYNYMVKASKLCGYNLYPYFEKWGFFRNIAIHIGDYADYYYVMMDDMFDEIQNDMAELKDDDGNKLKTMSDELIETISTADIPHFSTPAIPNDAPINAADF